jgi:hypothetical protein
VTQSCMLLGQPARAAAPLLKAVRKLQPSAVFLTPQHVCFLQVCVLAKLYKQAADLLVDDVYEVRPRHTTPHSCERERKRERPRVELSADGGLQGAIGRAIGVLTRASAGGESREIRAVHPRVPTLLLPMHTLAALACGRLWQTWTDAAQSSASGAMTHAAAGWCVQADPSQTGITAKDFLLYCYYGGSAYAGLKNWPKALEFYLHVRSHPNPHHPLRRSAHLPSLRAELAPACLPDCGPSVGPSGSRQAGRVTLALCSGTRKVPPRH